MDKNVLIITDQEKDILYDALNDWLEITCSEMQPNENTYTENDICTLIGKLDNTFPDYIK